MSKKQTLNYFQFDDFQEYFLGSYKIPNWQDKIIMPTQVADIWFKIVTFENEAIIIWSDEMGKVIDLYETKFMDKKFKLKKDMDNFRESCK